MAHASPHHAASESGTSSEVAELICPDCRYLLRGLPGVEITCPECGACHQRDELLQAANDRDDPIYLRLSGRLAVAVILSFLSLIAALHLSMLITELTNARVHILHVLACPSVLLASGMLLGWFIVRALPPEWGMMERWRLTLWMTLAHGGIVVGSFGVVCTAIAVLTLPFMLFFSASGTLICLSFIAVGAVCIWLTCRCVHLDQAVRRRCRARSVRRSA